MKNIKSLFVSILVIFTIFNSIAGTRYWVLGSGNWDNSYHWSTTSGGPGGASVPTINDHVVFDANSFLIDGTVAMALENYAKSIDFSSVNHSIRLDSGTDTNLYVSGDIIGNDQISFISNFDNFNLWLVGSATATIFCDGMRLPNVHIDSPDISVEIDDPFICSYLRFHEGELYSFGYPITATYIIELLGTGLKNLYLHGSTIRCRYWDSEFTNSANLVSIDLTNATIEAAEFYPGEGINFPYVILDGDLGPTLISDQSTLTSNTWSVDRLELINRSEFDIYTSIQVNDSLFIKDGATIFMGSDTLYINEFIGTFNDCSFATIKTQYSSPEPKIHTDINLNLDGWIFGGIERIGTGSIVSQGGLDLGDVEGITFTSGSTPTNIYWIGGSGDFTDINHYSTTSGGSADASCISGINTNVIFDHNSGLTNTSIINFPAGAYYMNDFKFINVNTTPTLSFEGSYYDNVQMFVHGDLSIAENAMIAYTNTSSTEWTFIGAHNHYINGNGKDLTRIVSDTEDLDIELLSDLRANEEVVVEKGDFTTNGHDVYSDKFNAKGDCSGLDCIERLIDFNGSVIDVKTFDVTFNYSNLELSGKYMLKCSYLEGGTNIHFDSIYLYDYSGTNSELRLNLYGQNAYHLQVETNSGLSIKSGAVIQNDFIIVSVDYLKGGFIYEEELEIQGDFITPTDNCHKLIPFYNSVFDKFHLKKDNGTINLHNMFIKNIITVGGATFNAINSRVVGEQYDWQVTEPTGTNMYWIGEDGDWTDANNWSTTSGGLPTNNGCIPSLYDNVVIDNNSFTADNQSIHLEENSSFFCNSLLWTANNYNGNEITFPVTDFYNQSSLIIGELIELDPGAIFNSSDSYNKIELGSNNLTIDANNVVLPELLITEKSTQVDLASNYSGQKITIEGGSFISNDYDITVDDLEAPTSNTKHFDPGKSTITVNGFFNLGSFAGDIFTYQLDSCIIYCEDFRAREAHFKELHLQNNNSIIKIINHDNHTYDKLYLHNTNVEVGVLHSNAGNVIIEELYMEDAGARLKIQDSDGITIGRHIEALNSGPKIEGRGSTYAGINAEEIICTVGNMEFVNINATENRINASSGIDGGGNNNINFDTQIDEGKLYWVGRSGVWGDPANWSFVSAGCPANTLAISTYDTLIIDNYGLGNGYNEITFTNNRTAKVMLFENDEEDVTFNIPYRFRPQEIIVKGGNVTFKDFSVEQNRAVQMFRTFHVINNGEAKIEDAILHVARKPAEITKSSLKVDATSELIGLDATFIISGHGTGVTDATVLFEPDATLGLFDAEFKTFEPLNGQPNNDIKFDLNGAKLHSLHFDNEDASSQLIKIASSFTCSSLEIGFGIMKILSGANVTIED